MELYLNSPHTYLKKLVLLSSYCCLNISFSFLKTVHVLAKEVSIVTATSRALPRYRIIHDSEYTYFVPTLRYLSVGAKAVVQS